jgi:Uma2 family endonuclease
MAAGPATKHMTIEEFLALPDDGVERWLIDGELREGAMTVRNWAHSRILIKVGYYLEAWNQKQPEPRGQVVGGEAGFRLRGEDDTVVGIDVAYISSDTVTKKDLKTSLINGAPVLAVEILSPNDKQQDIYEKVQKYLESGVQAVWVIDPDFQTVRVLEPGKLPQYFNRDQVLSGGSYLPGFQVSVAELFG